MAYTVRGTTGSGRLGFARQTHMIAKLRARLETAFTSGQFQYKELRGMFLTLVLDQFFIVFINMLSVAMVSSTGEAAIAAVSMVGSVNSLVVLVFSAIATGGAIVVARAKGSGDVLSVQCAIGESTGLCGASALALSALLFALADPLVRALYPAAEPLLIDYAIHYMRLMCVSFPLYAVFAPIFNAFRSVGDTRSSLLLTIVINGAHLLCSFLFINVWQLGVTGAGLAYIVARLIGMVMALVWLLKVHNEYAERLKHFFHFSKKITSEIARLGVPIASESALFQGGMLLVQVFLARLTTTDLAAHAVANSTLNLYYSTGNALTALASTVCGQCVGARQYELCRKYCLSLIRVGRAVMLVTVLICYPLTPLILMLYSPSPQALPIIYQSLTLAVAAMPLIWCDAYITPMALRAAGDATFSTVVSVAGLAVGRVALGYLLTITFGLGVPGVWLGMLVEWLARAAALRTRIRGERWLKYAKEESA